MDHDGPSSGRRKGRFVPKPPPPSRRSKTTVPKSESGDEEEEGLAQAQHLLQRFNDNQTRRKPKVEKKTQIAFGPGSPPSTLLKTYGTQKGGSSGRSTDPRKSSPGDDFEQIIESFPSISEEVGTDKCSSDAIETSESKIKQKDYIEPWDYDHSYYPTTLPLRRPHSGDPEVLDAAEFADADRNEYDEDTINAASDLDLLEKDEKRKKFFIQLPTNLPIAKRAPSAKGKEKVENSISCDKFGASKKNPKPEGLPGGRMGKMLVYKSGEVKLMLGEILFDVSPGSDCVFAQETAVTNTKEKHCCVIGDVGKRVVVTPDINSILDSADK